MITFNGKGYFVAGSVIGAIIILVMVFFVLSKKKQAQIS
jgi:hypothetical protein